jgi:hypothetical protein
MISNLGVYTNYNGFAVKMDASGNIIWQKLLNHSNTNDNINDVYETADGHLIIAASLKDFPDVGLVKLARMVVWYGAELMEMPISMMMVQWCANWPMAIT